ncbi:PR-1-like protein [Bimuria novae-zelandiae CBS 107.79]|uniref:PR-1-like protein n=1 Tax=Bimuria novae-zelandiae CBS 107.79 TaxID=1447943 RepID=A0A6A5UIL0_9PLEO|nr:PR-1-like protein [Bimuria novae-zelandiae CBS 107.79]
MRLFGFPAALVLLLHNQHTSASPSAGWFSSSAKVERADTPPSAKDYTDDDVFRNTVLNVTNTYRKQHNATAVQWNESLAEFAGEWSEKCEFKHSGGPSGENLASGYPNASQSIIAWGHERVDYDFKAGEFTHETGHFTQLVWKGTKTMGCGRTECNGKDDGEAPGWFVVCEYYPPGNVIGAFVQNVQEQVPEDEQPDGPSDPDVPKEEPDKPKECPQGGDCSAGVRLEVGGVVWAAGVAVWAAMWWL